jgi:hypothetical protein
MMDAEVDGPCGMHEREERCIQQTDLMEDLGTQCDNIKLYHNEIGWE